jgi:hypothetical protein
MDMTLKGEGIVRRLKELGLLTDDGQIKIGEASGSKIKEG